MNFKKRCILGLVIGLILAVGAYFCGMFGTMRYKIVLIVLAIVFAIVGADFGRRSIRGLIRVAVFNRNKSKELEKLEAIFSGGGISHEEYYARKIQLLNAEYNDR